MAYGMCCYRRNKWGSVVVNRIGETERNQKENRERNTSPKLAKRMSNIRACCCLVQNQKKNGISKYEMDDIKEEVCYSDSDKAFLKVLGRYLDQVQCKFYVRVTVHRLIK